MLSNDNRPTTFAEYVGQPGAIGYTKSIIKDNKHPNGIFITGMPGTGRL